MIAATALKENFLSDRDAAPASSQVITTRPSRHWSQTDPVRPAATSSANSVVRIVFDRITDDEIDDQEAAAPWPPKSIRAIAEISALQPDWDSYGAKMFDPDYIIDGLNVIEVLFSMGITEPEVYPTPNGTLQFEWSNKDTEIEAEFLPTGSFVTLIELDKPQSKYIEQTLTLTELARLVRDMSQQA